MLLLLFALTFFPFGSAAQLSEEDLNAYLPSNNNVDEDVTSPTADDVFDCMDGVWSVTSNNKDGNHTSITEAFGYSNIPLQQPMSKDSHFPIASNSKLYTTVAIYQLHEQGLLDVDADIATMLDPLDYANFGVTTRKFCPRVGRSMFSWRCEKITLRNLLSMSSGIYPALNCDAEPNAPHQCNPDPYILSQGSTGLTVGTFLFEPLIFKPGSIYHYSNPNFILAAYFVEKYSGQTFREYLKTNIFDRIGLKNTYYDFYNQGMGLDPKRATQYIRYHNKNNHTDLIAVGADIVQLDLGIASGTGGIISTVEDHATFWYTLFNKTSKGSPLLSSSSLQDILFPWTLALKQNEFLYPNGTSGPVWGYYTQGTLVICDTGGCLNGPRFIQYTGGTFTTHTANLLDYESFKMVQVWISTLVAMTDRPTFQAAFQQQTGGVLDVVGNWLDPEYNQPTSIAWKKMYETVNILHAATVETS